MTVNFKRPVSSLDVARLAGVSRSAVSRAFTEGTYISEDMRRRVLEAADSLGYNPNVLARSLMTRRSNIVGLVMVDLMNPYYANLLEILCQVLQKANLAALLLSSQDSGTLDSLIPKLLSYQADGVIIAGAILSSTAASQCAKAGRPVVLINRYVEQDGVNVVCSDNISGGRMVADHFVESGCRRIAFLAGLENTSSSRDREKGFVERLAEHGMRLHTRDVGNYNYQDGIDAARRLLSRKARPDAVFCANDIMAVAVIDAAKGEFGLRLPADLSVAGYDNTPVAASSGYDLTSVDQNVGKMAGKAVSLLLRQRDKAPGRSSRLTVPCRLQIRGSTRKPPK